MINIKIDDKALQQSFKEFTNKLNKTAEDSIIELARTGSTSLANHVEPFGTAKKAKNILEGSILKDISKAYHGTGKTYNEIRKISPNLAIAYIKAVKNNDLEAAERYARRAISNYQDVKYSDSGEYLQSIRGSKGRVTKDAPISLINDQEIESIRREKILSAGTAKAGFLQAGQSIGSKKRIPAWLKKSGVLGSSNIVRNGWKTVVTIINHVRYASNILSESRVNKAVRSAYKFHIKNLQRQVDKLAKNI